jgi:DNA modification methylase
MKVAQWPIDRVKPYKGNPRKIGAAAIAKVATSIREFGFQQPIVVDKDSVIIVGHTRLQAAQSLGLDKVPVLVADLPAAKVRAYRIADNRTHDEAEWAEDLLRVEFGDLAGLDIDLSVTGFDAAEIDAILADKTGGLTDPDDVPDAPVAPVSRLGDIWCLGRHRLVCGDSTNADDVAKALNGVSPHLMVTDPPYGVDYDPDWRNRADRANGKPYGASAIGLVSNDDRADWREAYALFPGDVIYAWHPPGAKQVEFYNSLTACGFEVRMQIIWAKSHFPIGRGNYHVQHEPCWYAVRKGKTGHWAGDRKQSTLWQIPKPAKSETGHSTQKPVECMRRPIVNNSSAGQAVYDPFLGSGTTLIAAEMEGRACHGLEISPAYCDVIVKRWEDFTGQKAVRNG